jgi:tetratricopeptide (TPR) repeat protein
MSTRADLGTLEASGLIEIAALQPELEYLFRHALVQEAAYASLLKQDRRALHLAAAETILALHPDRERALAAVVAMHLEQAGQADRAASYYEVAGEHALERYANREARGFFRRAVALAGDSQADLRIRASVGSAKAGWTFAESEDDVQQLERVLEKSDESDQRLVAEGFFWLALLRRQRGEVPETSPGLKRALDRSLELGLELNDPTAAALPRALMGSYMAFTGKLRQGEREMREALVPIIKTGDPVSIAMVSDFLAMTQSRLGDFEEAGETIERSRQFAGRGDEIARIDVDIALSALHLERGEPEKASEQAMACATRAEELGAYACVIVSNIMYGAASLATENATAARGPLERGKELCHLTGMAPMRTLLSALLGSTRARLGDISGGVASWDEALANSRGMGDRYGEAQTLWGRGRTNMLQQDADLPAALADLDRAIELFESMEAQPSLARALHDRVRVLRGLGRSNDADESERRSVELGSQLGLRDMPFA